MNSKAVITQFRREFWENRISFVITPALVSACMLLVIICASLFSGGMIENSDFHFSYTLNDTQTSITPPDQSPKLHTNEQADEKTTSQKFNAITSIEKDPEAFDNMVMASMYVNCTFLYLIFSIVLASYSLRCLFDDRKNKDILFWRSMPLSETTNVLIKLAMVVLAAPIIMLLLNMLITLCSIVIGLVFFGYFGVKISALLSSLFHGQALYIPLQICYELLFSLLMLLPIIGFAFFVSALAKKAPFFMFASPTLLVLADALLHKFWGLNLGVIDLFSVYMSALVHVKSAFVLHESFIFDRSMILPFISCITIGGLFISGAIWLRNHRYEI